MFGIDSQLYVILDISYHYRKGLSLPCYTAKSSFSSSITLNMGHWRESERERVEPRAVEALICSGVRKWTTKVMASVLFMY